MDFAAACKMVFGVGYVRDNDRGCLFLSFLLYSLWTLRISTGIQDTTEIFNSCIKITHRKSQYHRHKSDEENPTNNFLQGAQNTHRSAEAYIQGKSIT